MCRRESVWGNILRRLIYPVKRELTSPWRSLVLINPNYTKFWDISDPTNSKLDSLESLAKPCRRKALCCPPLCAFSHHHIISYAYFMLLFSPDITITGVMCSFNKTRFGTYPAIAACTTHTKRSIFISRCVCMVLLLHCQKQISPNLEFLHMQQSLCHYCFRED